MSESDRAVYGRALGTTLVGLAGLAAQGLLTSDAKAESASIRVLTSEHKHKDWFDLPRAYPDNPFGVEICATGDLDGDGSPDIIVGSPEGVTGSGQFMSVAKSKTGHQIILNDNKGGMRLADKVKIDPPDVFGIISGASTGPNTHIKLHSWDARNPSSPPTLLETKDAFPGQTMRSGVHVATGDLNGDGFTEVVVGPSGDVPPPGAVAGLGFLKIGDIKGHPDPVTGEYIKFRSELYPYGQDYRGGIRVATGDVDGDGSADLVTVGNFADHSTIRVFGEGQKDWPPRLLSTYDVGTSAGGGVSVAVGDVTGDGVAEMCVSFVKTHDKRDILIYNWSPPTNVTAGGPEADLVWSLYDTVSVYGPSSTYDGGFSMVIQDVTGDGIGDIIAAPLGIVPEPSSLALLSASAMSLRRKRRRPPD